MRLQLLGAHVEYSEFGSGTPLLFLHGMEGVRRSKDFINELASIRHVVQPSHPGFSKSTRPDWIEAIKDMTPIYLELLDRLGIGSLDVMGVSLGGWIAADLASTIPERINKLILGCPFGVKTGPRDKLDFPDIFAIAPEKIDKLLFHNAAENRVDPTALSNEELECMVRCRETLALVAWEPYMHDPTLKFRLSRIKSPTLLVRGSSDGLVSVEYLKRFSELISDVRVEEIPDAGHMIEVEKPKLLFNTVASFLNNSEAETFQ